LYNGIFCEFHTVNLVLDLGNTQHKCAVFENDQIVFVWKKEQLTWEDLESIFQKFQISNTILSSVDQHDPKLEEILQKNRKFLLLDPNTPLPINNAYATPETLGNDRLAAAVGANAQFRDKNVLIIDAGTCIKYDFVNAENVYLGGAISPGLNMRLMAMHNFTARLPLIDPLQESGIENIKLTGDTTHTSMISGTYTGALFESSGMIEAYASKYADLTVITTGGDAHFFELHLKRQIFALPNLVLEGLNTILNFNLNHN